MPMEVSCGQCHGRLVVETPGEIVACPHCGVHLMTPLADAPLSAPSATPSSLPPNPAHEEFEAIRRYSAETIVVKDSTVPLIDESPPIKSSLFHQDETENRRNEPNVGADVLPSHFLEPTQASIEQSSAISEVEFVHDAGHSDIHTDSVNSDNVVELDSDSELPQDLMATPDTRVTLPDFLAHPGKPKSPTEGSVSTPSLADGPDFSWMSAQRRASPTTSSTGVSLNFLASGEPRDESPSDPPPSVTARSLSQPSVSMEVAPPFNSFTPPSTATSGFESFSADGRSPTLEKTKPAQSSMAMLLLIIGCYASLLTIYVVYLSIFGRQQQLESLPDLKTVQQLGGRAVVPRPENELPPGHELRLGEAQRYGNIIATPLRVTRGPIAFTHYSGDPTQVRATSDPVLKLWIRFENVSTNQSIAPLDTTLMFFRRIVNDRVASYNAIFPAAQRKQSTPHFPFDRVAEDSEWRIVGQHTNETLKPQQSFETFIPSEEHVEDLTGEIIWRVHFRKGYGPKSGNGVTTLIDVHFQSDEITADPA